MTAGPRPSCFARRRPTSGAAGSIEVVFESRPARTRRLFREQRLAARAARPRDQAHVGQRRAGEPGDREATRRNGRRRLAAATRQSNAANPGAHRSGHRRDAAIVHFGYGRTGAEEVAHGVGVDAYQLLAHASAHSQSACSVERAVGARRHDLAITQSTGRWKGAIRRAARHSTPIALISVA